MLIDDQFTEIIEERRVSVDGVTTQILTAGDGPPVVLVPGDGDNPAVWQWVIPTLAREHRVFALSLPGHADSDKPRIDYTREYMRDFVRATLDALELEHPVLFGNSIGGQTALWLALAEPERFPALILLDSSGLGWEVNPSLALESLPFAGEFAIAAARAPFGGAMRATSRVSQLFWRPDRAPATWLAEEARQAQVAGFLEASIAAKRAVVSAWGQRQVLLDQLHRLTMPVLVMWGANDRVLPVTHAQAAVRRLPHGELAVIPSCGHVGHVERPDAVLKAVLPFLARHARAAEGADEAAALTADTTSGDDGASTSPIARTVQAITKKRS